MDIRCNLSDANSKEIRSRRILNITGEKQIKLKLQL